MVNGFKVDIIYSIMSIKKHQKIKKLRFY